MSYNVGPEGWDTDFSAADEQALTSMGAEPEASHAQRRRHQSSKQPKPG